MTTIHIHDMSPITLRCNICGITELELVRNSSTTDTLNCMHGGHARSCLTCEQIPNEEIEKLKEKADAMADAMHALISIAYMKQEYNEFGLKGAIALNEYRKYQNGR